MHQPTVEMRNAAGLNNKALLESATKLFGLERMLSKTYGSDNESDNESEKK